MGAPAHSVTSELSQFTRVSLKVQSIWDLSLGFLDILSEMNRMKDQPINIRNDLKHQHVVITTATNDQGVQA